MAINHFFNLKSENINNNLKVIINKIAKSYSIKNKTYRIDKKDIIYLKLDILKK